MKLHIFSVRQEPGFRLNLFDLVFLGLLGLLGWGVHRVYPLYYLYLIPPYIGLTFFIFCNVFRIGDRLEAVWYVTFIALNAAFQHRPELYWPVVLAVCEPLKVGLIVFRIWKGGYRGVFASRVKK